MLELARLWMRCRAELQMLRPNPNGMLQCYGKTWRGSLQLHVGRLVTSYSRIRRGMLGALQQTIDPPYLLPEGGALQHRNLGQLLISDTTSRYTI